MTPEPTEEQRKQDEIDFHNARDVDQQRMNKEAFYKKYPNKSFYCITDNSKKYWQDMILGNCNGKQVLDYCCGTGGNSRFFASHGASVTGIDLSDSEIETAKKLAKKEGFEKNTSFFVMDAEATSFPDESFDIIVCCGVLHHVDLDKAYKELNRLLRKGGRIICIEAFGHNPIIRQYRKRTPNLRTPWEVDHILKKKDIEKGRKYFQSVTTRYFHLAAIAAIPLRRSFLFRPALAILNTIDAVILRIPGIRLMAWQAIFVFKK